MLNDDTNIVRLRGGVELTPDECKKALDEAMRIIEKVGTTGIYSMYYAKRDWMKAYYPAYAD